MLGLGIALCGPRRPPRPARRALRGAARRRPERLHGGRHRRHRRAGLVARGPHHRLELADGSLHRAASHALRRLGPGRSSPRCCSPSWRPTSACSGWRSRRPRWSTTFLVGHRRTKGSLEASWKYIVICSVGIALAFLGTVLVYLAALHAGGHSAHALDWTSLMAHARPPRPLGDAPRLRPRRPRLRHQGGSRPDAQLAARRPQPGAGPDLRPDVGGPPHRGLLRHLALQGDL